MKKSEVGQGLVEYALILVLVAVVVVAVLRLLGPQIGNTFCAIPVGHVDPSWLCVTAVNDHVYTPQDTERIINVAYNDHAREPYTIDPASAILIEEGPNNGSVVNNGDGTFTFEPDIGFIGIDSFGYRIGTGFLIDRAIVTIGVGILVRAVDDSTAAGPGRNWSIVSTRFNVIANDFILGAPGDHPLDPTAVGFTLDYTNPEHGRLTYYPGTGDFFYVADPGYRGQDNFEYTICNANESCDAAQVTIHVDPVSSANSRGTNDTTRATNSREILASVNTESNSRAEFQPNLLSVQESAAVDPDPQNLLTLYEDVTNQDAAFTLASYPVKEIVYAIIEVLLTSDEISQDAKDSLPGIKQDISSGEEERIYASMETLNLILGSTPADELNQVIAVTRYHWLAACDALDGAQVSSYEAALETLYALEEMDPGNTGNAIPELEEIGVQIEFRNAVVAYHTEICTLITETFLDWDDLHQAIADAAIDKEGIRQSFQDQTDEAKAAFYSGNIEESGNTLCALLKHLDAQEGKHIEPVSAEEIRNTATAVAAQLGIPLSCDP